MLKTETNRFGEFPARVDGEGKVITPARPGVEVVCTQLPCSMQREVFAWLIRQFPEDLPGGLVIARKLNPDGAYNFAYRVCRRILAAEGGLAYLQRAFATSSVAIVQRNGKPVREPLDEGLVDELFGAQLSILLEWLIYSLIFNFSDVINLLPEWGKEIPSIVATAMMDGEQGAPVQKPE